MVILPYLAEAVAFFEAFEVAVHLILANSALYNERFLT
jgi:hypothetical protein